MVCCNESNMHRSAAMQICRCVSCSELSYQCSLCKLPIVIAHLSNDRLFIKELNHVNFCQCFISFSTELDGGDIPKNNPEIFSYWQQEEEKFYSEVEVLMKKTNKYLGKEEKHKHKDSRTTTRISCNSNRYALASDERSMQNFIHSRTVTRISSNSNRYAPALCERSVLNLVSSTTSRISRNNSRYVLVSDERSKQNTIRATEDLVTDVAENMRNRQCKKEEESKHSSEDEKDLNIENDWWNVCSLKAEKKRKHAAENPVGDIVEDTRNRQKYEEKGESKHSSEGDNDSYKEKDWSTVDHWEREKERRDEPSRLSTSEESLRISRRSTNSHSRLQQLTPSVLQLRSFKMNYQEKFERIKKWVNEVQQLW